MSLLGRTRLARVARDAALEGSCKGNASAEPPWPGTTNEREEKAKINRVRKFS